MKFDKEKITMLTAYDYTTAKMVDAGGIDAVLIETLLQCNGRF